MSLETMKEKYGEDFYYVQRSRKHRYIYFHADRKDKKMLESKLKYGIEPYPKGDSRRYDSGGNVATQMNLF